MKYLKSDALKNYDYNLKYLRDHNKLKYLYKSISEIMNNNLSEKKINFIFLESFEQYCGYISYLYLLEIRAGKIKTEFGKYPNKLVGLDYQINSDGYSDSNGITRDTISFNKKVEVIDNFWASIVKSNKEREFELNYYDENSVIFIHATATTGENLIYTVKVNDYRAPSLFSTNKADYTHAFDQKANVCISNLKYILDNNIVFTDEGATPKLIIITYDAIRKLLIESSDENITKESLVASITLWCNENNINKIIIISSADKGLLARDYIEIFKINTPLLNTFTLGDIKFCLEGDFENKSSFYPIKTMVSSIDKDMHISTYLKNVKDFLYKIERTEENKFLLHQIEKQKFKDNFLSALYSLLPDISSLEAIAENIIDLSKEIEQSTILQNNLNYIISALKLNSDNEEFLQIIEYLNSHKIYTAVFLTDNSFNLRRETKKKIIQKFKEHSINLEILEFDWEKMEEYENSEIDYILNINLFKYNQSWERLFKMGLNHWKTKSHWLFYTDIANASFFRNAITSFENFTEENRNQIGCFNDCHIIDLEQFNEEINKTDTGYYSTIDDIIKNKLSKFLNRKKGSRPRNSAGDPNDPETMTVYFNDENVSPLFDVPSNRVYHLTTHGKSKHVYDLEEGDEILVFDRTQDLKETVLEYLLDHDQTFKKKFDQSQIWINVLKKYRDNFTLIELQKKLASYGLTQHPQTINNWIRYGLIDLDDKYIVMDAVLQLIIDNQYMFENIQHKIGNSTTYMDQYSEIIIIIRSIENQIVKIVRGSHEITPDVIQYKTILKEFSGKVQRLTVYNVE
jgi:hypothetical protein